ncbi:chlorophyll synthase ChlG [Methylocapsa palsarum]|uniref:Chlorophyll synthase n=1 Tax=Methylocapsa palsarum TaxID=1612308 RepID=A0A1I4BBG3_9HYPH|nr:chlorophyll synthase ChlG [Methylocapsa palsarum]SFK66128.1 chlorophyll synthase [Methylocapsa palsarum]
MPRLIATLDERTRLPAPRAIVELLKPITWFPPMWAFGCGVAASPQPTEGRWPTIIAGLILAGPLVCATSQAVNDWFDRGVDAINEPDRPIPSGRIPGAWGLYIASAWTALSLLVAAMLGVWVFAAAAIGLALAWAYSAPPLRLKRNGWWGNAACGLCYEGLAWITGGAVMAGGVLPDWRSLTLAGLYSFGAHGIMTLNDFKSIEGDRQMGLGSLPVRLGVNNAARVACIVMALPQIAVAGLLLVWGRPVHAGLIVLALAAQAMMMSRFLKAPREKATWYSGAGIPLYVLGMLVSALAVHSILLETS